MLSGPRSRRRILLGGPKRKRRILIYSDGLGGIYATAFLRGNEQRKLDEEHQRMYDAKLQRTMQEVNARSRGWFSWFGAYSQNGSSKRGD